MLFSFISLVAAASLTTALPTISSRGPIYPPTSTAQNFQLVANVTGTDLPTSIQNYRLTGYHIGAGIDYAVLVPNTIDARTFYVNGTAEEVRYGDTDVLSDGGTPPFPFGVIFQNKTQTISNGEHAVMINGGLGTRGVSLTEYPNPVHHLQGPGAGVFYACENSLPYGEAVQLLYKYSGETTPEGCAELKLLPQCAEGDGVAHNFSATVNCYPDVASIDWTVYG